MQLTRLLLVLSPCALIFAQSDLFDKAPPALDEALRARITIFYDAQISGKYHEALKVVAEEALDDFMGSSKDTYKGCEISKITYSENYTKAAVVTACKGEYRWHGSHMPVTMPLNSDWKVVDGQWYWYHIKQTAVETPWGISRANPENSGGSQMPAIPPDPAALARGILSMVKIDKKEVELKGYEASKAELHVTNEMNGSVTLTVDRLPLAGTKVTIQPAELPAGGKATIVFSYDPNDASIACAACVSKQVLPTMTANVRVSPTNQAFPIRVQFAVSPEVLKQLPNLPKSQQ